MITVWSVGKDKHYSQMGNVVDSAMDKDKYLTDWTACAKDHFDKYKENATKSAQ